MEQETEKRRHRLSLDRRARLEIEGVVEVESFDDVGILLLTDCGELNIEGKELKIGVLDTDKGVLSIEGRVDAVYYSEERQKRGRSLFSKRQK
jgi:sporulation protein YabP